MRARFLISLLAASIGCGLSASSAHAGNDDGILLGNDAALMGGAVVGAVSDGSALWYNPAGLAHARMLDTLDVSGSAFVLRNYRIPRLLSASDGSRDDASTTELVSVPSALTFVRPLGKRITAGLGLFTPQSNDFTLRSSIETQSSFATRWQLALSNEQTQYQAGGGLAFNLGERVLLGVSLLGAYETVSGSLQVSSILETLDRQLAGFGVQSLIHQSTLLGAHLDAGAIIRLAPLVSLGLSIRSPSVAVFHSQRVTVSQGAAGVGEQGGNLGEFDAVDERKSGGEFSMYAPLRARLGLAFHLPSGVLLDVEGDVQHAVTNRDLDIDRVFTWNLRAGARVQLREHFAVGAGLFTDRAGDKRAADGTGPIHFYGGAVGVQYWSTRKLDASEPQERLTFSTTGALRYAHGSGKFLGSFIDADSGEVADSAVPVAVDEISLHLGSALHF